MLEDPSAQRVVELYDGILKSRGRALSPASVILDYGCGSGRHAYEFLDAGFPHVSGYDVQDYVKVRLPADRERFRFDPTSGDGTEYPAMTKVPWPDNTFDFVFATQVFEHVSDQELAYSEVHRVLKPGGSFLNIFPSKWRPIEAHINIPFGGVLTSRRYHQFCAALGIRGLNQEHCTPDQVVELNRRFITQGVNYSPAGRSPRSWIASSASSNTWKMHSSATAREDRAIWRCRSNSYRCYASSSVLRIRA